MADLIIYTMDGVKNLGEKEKEKLIETKMEAAAEGIFNALDSSLKGKYNQKSIFNLIKKSDSNHDGKITSSEAAGDKDNIFGLKSSEKLSKVQKSVNKEQKLVGIKGLQKGIGVSNFTWKMAKPFVLANTDAKGLKEMFSTPEVMKYYNAEMGKISDTNKHLAEVFKAKGISVEDIKKLGFAEDTLKEILEFYKKA